MLKRIIKITLITIGVLTLLIIVLIFYVRTVAQIDTPAAPPSTLLTQSVTQVDRTLFKLGNNWFRKSESGLYELYIEGTPFDRGVAIGKLTKHLIHHQE